MHNNLRILKDGLILKISSMLNDFKEKGKIKKLYYLKFKKIKNFLFK